MDYTLAFQLVLVTAFAGVMGSMLGLGGGVFMVPLFTLFLGVDEKVAIGASAVAVVLNSVVGSSVHLRSRFTNLRLAMLLQVPTATGALVGALLAVRAPERLLNALFGAVLTYAAVSMLIRRNLPPLPISEEEATSPLRARYHDPATKMDVDYAPVNLSTGLSISGAAGFLSGMLGVGGGVIQVPAMNLFMRIPVKAAAGTSAFMVGITAVATSLVFYADEQLDPTIVGPALVGIMLGAQAGSRLTRRFKAQRLVMVFVVVLLYLGLSLLLKAGGISLPGQD
ncbi:MAG: sulfite exporter TauE/SafE family protein [Thermomicrobiales bacterium]|nr:sulfite exporter TauE/SafE family protein [Thermomicrobiales bacterium]